MLRSIAFLAVLACSACANSGHPLAETSANDPIWQLNTGRWLASTNDLVVPPASRAVVVQQ